MALVTLRPHGDYMTMLISQSSPAQHIDMEHIYMQYYAASRRTEQSNYVGHADDAMDSMSIQWYYVYTWPIRRRTVHSLHMS